MTIRSASGIASYQLVVLIAFALAMLLVTAPYTSSDVLLAGLLVAVLVAAPFVAPRPDQERVVGIGALALAALMTISRLGGGSDFTAWTVVGLAAAAALLATIRPVVRADRWWLAAWGIGLVVMFLALGWSDFDLDGDPTIDVYDLHVAGADALAAGANPYVHAEAPNTSPTASAGDTFQGYPYPPLVLAMFSVGHWLFGDPRVTSLIALGVFAAIVVGAAMRTDRTETRFVMLALLLVIAADPGVAFVVNQSWTEPVALPLLAGAAFLWNRRPTAAWVLVGLLLATKQYWVLAAPVLIAMPDAERWRRVAIAGGVALATLAPALIADLAAFVDATIVPTFDALPRTDSANLLRLGVEIPGVLSTAAVIVAGVVLGRRAHDPSRTVVALGAVLAMSLMLGFAAFANHWLMVATLAMVGLMVPQAANRSVRSEESGATKVRVGHD